MARVKIAKIVRVERWKVGGKKHSRTHVVADDGDEVAGYGDWWKVGDPIITFFNDSKNRAQFIADPIDNIMPMD